MRSRCAPILRVAERPFQGEHPLSSLIRVYVAANAIALTVALLLTGAPEQAHGAADAVWTWCHVG